tara:strand:- start:1275 stop:1544 length:270 start_codon:yes stop_codon:yes gene_type:complete
MPESKKSPQEDNSKWMESVVNESIIRSDNKLLEDKIDKLQKEVDALKARPIAKIMYRPPGHTKHLQLAEYLDTLENRLNTIELRIELDV